MGLESPSILHNSIKHQTSNIWRTCVITMPNVINLILKFITASVTGTLIICVVYYSFKSTDN